MSRPLTRVLGSLLLAALVGASGTGAAQSDEEPGATERAEPQKKHETRGRWGRSRDRHEETDWSRHYSIGPRTAKHLVEARELLTAEQYDAAEAALDKLRMRSLNPLEKAQAYRMYAFVAYGREDYAAGRDYLEKTLAQDVLSPDDAADVRFQIAQLWLQEEHWAEAARNLELWFGMVENPNPAAYYLLALTYYQLEQLDKAVGPAQTAVDRSEQPKESWLQLLLALRLTRKEYAEAVPLLERLIALYPKKNYWLSLSTVYGALGDYQEALIPLQVAYTEGLLTEDAELRRLAQLLLYLELPYRASLVLRQGLDGGLIQSDTEAWELLSNSWIAAREFDKAVEPLEQAARLAAGGDLYVRLAQVHIQREKWSEAVDALGRAFDKGGLENPGDAQLLMGIALYSQKRPGKARTWFARARQHEASRGEADTWIRYIDRELQSQAG